MKEFNLELKYFNQLSFGCKRFDCVNIFCRIKEDKFFKTYLVKNLLKYKDTFLCKNIINKEQTQIYNFIYQNTFLDWAFFFITPFNTERVNLEDIKLKKNYDKKLSENDQTLLNLIFNKTLKNYTKKTHTISYQLLRIFISFNIQINIKRTYLLNFSQLFNDLKNINKYTKIKGIEFINKNTHNTKKNKNLDNSSDQILLNQSFNDLSVSEKYYKNFFENYLTPKEFSSLIEIFKKRINSLKENDIRFCKELSFYFEILEKLYFLNENYEIFPYQKFYLNDFCNSLDLKKERKSLKKSLHTPLNYYFSLPLSIKNDVIKLRNLEIMKEKLKNTFFEALFCGARNPYLKFLVNRRYLFKDCLNIVRKTKVADLQKQMKVTFENEEGVDVGGITREFFQIVSRHIVKNKRLFDIKGEFLWFNLYPENYQNINKNMNNNIRKSKVSNNKKSNIQKNKKKRFAEYTTIGRIIGLGFFNGMVLNIPFPTLFFKKLLNKTNYTLNDIKLFEPEIHNSLTKIKKFKDEEFHILQHTFQINYEINGICYMKELIPGGKNILLKKKNVDQFIDLYIKWICDESIKDQFKAIREGFFSIVDFQSIQHLKPEELEKILVGSQFIDVKFLRKHVVYRDFWEEDPLIRNFWAVVQKFDEKTLRKLLLFVTGNDRVPVSSLDDWNIHILRNGCDTNRLPSAQTCFNILLLPYYETREKLEEKLKIAINNTKGFFLL